MAKEEKQPALKISACLPCAQVSKVIGERWKALGQEEKQSYLDLAEQDKVRDLQMPA